MLSACVASSQAADPSQLQKIHSIALSGFLEPKYKVVYGMGFDEGSEFDVEMNAQHLQLGADTRREVTAKLSKAGYAVVDSASQPADAVLDLDFENAGYVLGAPIAGGGATLMVLATAKLRESGSDRKLFQQTFWFASSAAQPIGWQTLHSDEKYDFADVDDLLKNPEQASLGLKSFSTAVAIAIAAKLEKH